MAKSEMTKAMEAIADKLVGVDVTELPAVSASDNGKILMVVNGKWAAAAAPTELPAVTAEDVGATLAVDAEGKWAKVAAAEG